LTVKQCETKVIVFYLMADLMHHHHGELHLIGEGGDIRIQQDLLLTMVSSIW